MVIRCANAVVFDCLELRAVFQGVLACSGKVENKRLRCKTPEERRGNSKRKDGMQRDRKRKAKSQEARIVGGCRSVLRSAESSSVRWKPNILINHFSIKPRCRLTLRSCPSQKLRFVQDDRRSTPQSWRIGRCSRPSSCPRPRHGGTGGSPSSSEHDPRSQCRSLHSSPPRLSEREQGAYLSSCGEQRHHRTRRW
jgi:hypothetical protein